MAIFIRGNQLAQVVFIILYSFLGGFNIKDYDVANTHRVCAHFPESVAFRVLAHFGQRVHHTDDVRAFDYGHKANWIRYGSPDPPTYDLSKITNKHMVFFSGTNDFIAPLHNVHRLKHELRGKVNSFQV